MIVTEILLIALRAIRANVLRSVLTCLGIIIGVAAVITMMALGRGAQEAVQAQIESMGTNLLYVRPQMRRSMGVAQGERDLTPEDAAALADEASSLVAVVPEMSRGFQVEHQGENTQTTVIGTTPEYATAENFQLAHGRFFDRGEVEGRARVAVVGSEVANNLKIAPADLVGQAIKIGGMRFEVIGTLAEKGQVSWFNPDDQVVVPLGTARFRLFGDDRLRSITVQVAAPGEVPLAMSEIERILRRRHRLREGQENDFTIRDQSDLRSTFESTTRTFSYLLAGIAAVSLLVGGIGIMNIMLVSVTERTREIGVRKAVGATARQILLQFLIEALVLCSLGGALGVALGGGAAHLLSRLAGWSLIIGGDAVALALGFAAAIGLSFGIYPAARAAHLHPIEALRYE